MEASGTTESNGTTVPILTEYRESASLRESEAGAFIPMPVSCAIGSIAYPDCPR